MILSAKIIDNRSVLVKLYKNIIGVRYYLRHGVHGTTQSHQICHAVPTGTGESFYGVQHISQSKEAGLQHPQFP